MLNEFFSPFINWLSGLGLSPAQGIWVIVIIGIFVTIYFLTKNNNFWSFLKGRKNTYSFSEYYQVVENKKKLLESERDKIYNDILKKQMEFASQKILDILLLFITDFAKRYKNTKDCDEVLLYLIHLKDRLKTNTEILEKIDEIIEQYQNDKELVQKKMYYWFVTFEFLERIIRIELQRSFIENGFHSISENDFLVYKQNRCKKLNSLIKQSIINNYPNVKSLVVTQEQVLEQIDQLESEINNNIFQIYDEVKKIKVSSENEINKLENEFKKDLNNFEELIKNK